MCYFYVFIKVPLHSLRHHYEFPTKFNQLKMKRPLYKNAVREFLLELADLHKFQINFSQRGYLNVLLKWALNGFLENGTL